jgi:SsrA-binding protein
MNMATYIDNRKAHFNYAVEETFEAGIELQGFEVKSVKGGQGTINSAFVIVRGGEAYIMNMHIPPYQPNNTDPGYDPDRTRRLLLSKKEIKKLADKDSTKGLTLIPLSLYSKGRYIKVSIAVARGKRVFDKRETIKKRETDREISREYKVR